MAIELVSRLFGKGSQVPRREGEGLMVSAKPGKLMHFQPPPFFGI